MEDFHLLPDQQERITRHSSKAVDHILKKAVLSANVWSGILILDHFLIFSYFNEEIFPKRKGEEIIFKREITDQSVLVFRNILPNYKREDT